MRFLYALQLRVAPRTYEAVYQLTAKRRFVYSIAYRFALLACYRLNRWARDYDVIVTTYPMAGQALGHMRRLGLRAKVVIFLTDMSVHPLWVNRHADLHLTLAQGPADDVASIEPLAHVRVAGAVVRPGFMGACANAGATDASVAPTMPCNKQPTVLLVAGSWGVGELETVAKEVVGHGLPIPIVVCGNNRRLYRSFNRELGIVLGWVDDMVSVMRTADVLVHNAGGLMAVEALAAGMPVIGYRCIPGHGCANSEAMARAGVALHACPEGSVMGILSGLSVSVMTHLGAHARELFFRDPAQIISSVTGGSNQL